MLTGTSMNKSAQGPWVVSADRIRNEHILSMQSVTNEKSQSCWLAPLGWWGWLWINDCTASDWPHNGAKCYVILCYTDCLFCALNKVINTWPASHIERIKSVLMSNMLTNRPMENFKRIFLNEKDWILIEISLKFVPKGTIDNKVGYGSSNVLAPNRPQVFTCTKCWPSSPMHMCDTRGTWVKLDESTARRHLKSPRSLSSRSLHLTLVSKCSRSHLTVKIHMSRSWPRSNPLVIFEAWR